VILANTVGSMPGSFAPLEHARWVGLTLADVGLPFLLFIVGIGAELGLAKRLALGVPRRSLLAKATLRATVLFALGLLGNLLREGDLATFRVMGVLQRIALAYLLAMLVALAGGWRVRALAAAALLVGYWLLMTLVPVPDTGARGLETLLRPETNLAAWLDRLVLGAHIWSETGTWDPEGLLSTVPAVATVLMGMLAATWLRRPLPIGQRTWVLFAAGVAAVLLGLLWSPFLPIIKGIWSSSYGLVTTGLAAVALAFCLAVTDVWRVTFWTPPLVAFGVNPLALYVGSGVLHGVLGAFPAGGARGSVRDWIYQAAFESWLYTDAASLAYGLAYTGLWLAIAWWLYRRGVRIKV